MEGTDILGTSSEGSKLQSVAAIGILRWQIGDLPCANLCVCDAHISPSRELVQYLRGPLTGAPPGAPR